MAEHEMKGGAAEEEEEEEEEEEDRRKRSSHSPVCFSSSLSSIKEKQAQASQLFEALQMFDKADKDLMAAADESGQVAQSERVSMSDLSPRTLSRSVLFLLLCSCLSLSLF